MNQDNEKLMRSIRLMRSFRRVQKNMMCLDQQTAARNGLSMPQYAILMTLAKRQDMTQKTVGEVSFLPKSTLSQAVDGLAREGLLERQQVEDNRREMGLALTAKGEALVHAIHSQQGGSHQRFQEAVESLTDEQYEKLLELHQHISAHLEIRDLEEQRR
ncbi:MarR family transcriptional regulator [Planococcus shenhongbingii]|uniref:MarR family transcriptional regulator n=1 Tax=Planococcus shenhongbingii TaxID=3058398 RepID=A0ABT8NES9_9BACL|nr:MULTISPECIES: MarR family transcriptional regulator [unclassified Planococcus (in: firmicutes)]MDN7246214.1 MarR family transcriptional regulator [Planococcus sp. N017]WKA59221.1 MarR family transcriptional regulator [Planococcus sp. N016]